MKKLLSLLLVSVILLMSFVACANTTTKETQATEKSTGTETDKYTQIVFESAVPKGLDFEGVELVLYTTAGYNSEREWVKVEGYENEIDMAVQDRNDKVEAEMNLKIRVEAEVSPGNWDKWNETIHTNILNDVATGHFYDMYTMGSNTNYLKVRGAQANLLDNGVFPYFDFTKPCWTQSIVNFAVNGKLFFAVGDLNIKNIESTTVVWHNKTLYDEVKTSDDPDDLQDYALDGLFNYDVLYRWANLVVEGGTGVKHDNKYGLGDMTGSFYSVAPYAWDFKMVTENADGTYSFNIIGNEKGNNAVDDIRTLGAMKGVNTCLGAYTNSNVCTAQESQAKHFAAGKFMFFFSNLYLGEEDGMLVREMADKYCVLPFPKYYEDQSAYYTTVVSPTMTSALNHPEGVIRGEAISAFYQRSTELSYTDIRAMYIESIIKPRFFGADDDDGTVSKSIDTFNEIYSSIKFDLISVYGAQIEKINWLVLDMIEKNDRSLEENFISNDNTWGITVTQEMYEKALKDWEAFMWS